MVDIFYWVLEIFLFYQMVRLYNIVPIEIILYQQAKEGNFDPEKHTYS